jgi:hypothetical protein
MHPKAFDKIEKGDHVAVASEPDATWYKVLDKQKLLEKPIVNGRSEHYGFYLIARQIPEMNKAGQVYSRTTLEISSIKRWRKAPKGK